MKTLKRRVGEDKGCGYVLPKDHDQRTDPQTVTRFAGQRVKGATCAMSFPRTRESLGGLAQSLVNKRESVPSPDWIPASAGMTDVRGNDIACKSLKSPTSVGQTPWGRPCLPRGGQRVNLFPLKNSCKSLKSPTSRGGQRVNLFPLKNSCKPLKSPTSRGGQRVNLFPLKNSCKPLKSLQILPPPPPPPPPPAPRHK